MTSMLSQLASLTAAIATATAPAGTHNLHYITQQVEHFYGDGWHTLLWEVGLITATLNEISADEFISALQANHKSEMPYAIKGLKERTDRLRKEVQNNSPNEYMRDTLLNNIRRCEDKYNNTFGASMDHKENEERK